MTGDIQCQAVCLVSCLLIRLSAQANTCLYICASCPPGIKKPHYVCRNPCYFYVLLVTRFKLRVYFQPSRFCSSIDYCCCRWNAKMAFVKLNGSTSKWHFSIMWSAVPQKPWKGFFDRVPGFCCLGCLSRHFALTLSKAKSAGFRHL